MELTKEMRLALLVSLGVAEANKRSLIDTQKSIPKEDNDLLVSLDIDIYLANEAISTIRKAIVSNEIDY